MRKWTVLSGVAGALTASVAIAQATQPSPTRDGTGNVRSQTWGAPGTTSDPMRAYEQQRSLNNLPGQKAAEAKYGRARPAKADELTVGVTVNDNLGVAMATIEQVDPDGVVVSMGGAKIKVPAEAFGHNKAGLLLDVSKDQFKQVVAKANAGP